MCIALVCLCRYLYAHLFVCMFCLLAYFVCLSARLLVFLTVFHVFHCVYRVLSSPQMSTESYTLSAFSTTLQSLPKSQFMHHAMSPQFDQRSSKMASSHGAWVKHRYHCHDCKHNAAVHPTWLGAGVRHGEGRLRGSLC